MSTPGVRPALCLAASAQRRYHRDRGRVTLSPWLVFCSPWSPWCSCSRERPRRAYAHADLQQAEPAAGAAVPAPPAELRLRFTEPLDRSATRVEVIDERGARLDHA